MIKLRKLITVFLVICIFSAFSVNAIAENVITSDIVITKADMQNTQISEEIVTDSVEEDNSSPIMYVLVATGSLCVISVLYLAVKNLKHNKGNKNDL